MNDVEYFGKLSPKRLTSLDEDFKACRKEFQEDEKQKALKRAGKIEVKLVKTRYERDSDECN